MKKILLFTGLLCSLFVHAQVKISDMPTHTGSVSGIWIPAVVAGANKKVDGALFSASSVPLSRTITINGVTYDLSSNRSWTVNGLPSLSGNSGKFLTNDGTSASWAAVSASLPSQTGNSGKYLTTDGTNASWGNVTAGVSSFNSRTGAVVPASGDYAIADITGLPSSISAAAAKQKADSLTLSDKTILTNNYLALGTAKYKQANPGGVTSSVGSGGLTMSVSSTGNLYNYFVDTTQLVSSENYVDKLEFIVNGTSGIIWVGKNYYDVTGATYYNFQAKAVFSSGTVTVALERPDIGSPLKTSTRSITFSATDRFTISIKRFNRYLAAYLVNETTGTSTMVDYQFPLAGMSPDGRMNLPGGMYPSFGIGGGSFTVVNHKSIIPKPHYLAGLFGDSISEGYTSTGFTSNYYATLNQYLGGNCINLSQGGARTSSILASLGNLSAFKCHFGIINLGINDALNSVSSSTYIANMKDIVTAMLRNDIIPIITTVQPWHNGNSINATIIPSLNTAISTAFNNDLIIVDTYTEFNDGSGALKAKYDAGDGHLNDIGQTVEALGILNATKSPLTNQVSLVSVPRVLNAAKDGWDTLALKSEVRAAGGGGSGVPLLNIVDITPAFTLSSSYPNATDFYCNNTTAAFITIPTNATDAISVGTFYSFTQNNTGVVGIQAASGVTLIAPDNSSRTRVYGSNFTVKKKAVNTWYVVGDIY